MSETSCDTQEKRSLDAASESRTPQIRKDWVLTILLHSWHHQTHESVVHCRGCLNIWGQNLRMFSEVKDKGVTGPPPFYLHDVERYASQEVFECGANA